MSPVNVAGLPSRGKTLNNVHWTTTKGTHHTPAVVTAEKAILTRQNLLEMLMAIETHDEWDALRVEAMTQPYTDEQADELASNLRAMDQPRPDEPQTYGQFANQRMNAGRKP